MEFEAVIGLEVHAELETESKMFCACAVVDPLAAEPNRAVCPICAGMPGVLPVLNEKAVEYGIRVALALQCEISTSSIFVRKNYFYPDLPKGYQISQYEHPLAQGGRLPILTSKGEWLITIRRVHLEEDTGKLTHVSRNNKPYSLIDLNRAGIPLLEIVSEPEFRTAEEVRAYAVRLRSLLRYLEVNSGDMQKGVIRIEPNVSVRVRGETKLGTRVEIKNLNSFRALERAVDYEIQRQSKLLAEGKPVIQETVGWDEAHETTLTQRVKESEQDYRYFPEPDLPPLVISPDWIERIREDLPELPAEKYHRFQQQYDLSPYDAGVLVEEKPVAEYFEQTVNAVKKLCSEQSDMARHLKDGKDFNSIKPITPKNIANWITGEIFALLNQTKTSIETTHLTPQSLAYLIYKVAEGELNKNTAREVLTEMFQTGKSTDEIVDERGLAQISDISRISQLVAKSLIQNPDQVSEYLVGKEAVYSWLFGEVMRATKGQANPRIVREELQRQLKVLQDKAGGN